MKLYILTLFLVSACWVPCLAADGPENDEKPRPEEVRRKRSDAFQKRLDQALETLKETDPKRYDELIKLRETDRRRFMAEMRPMLHSDNPRTDKPPRGKGSPNHSRGPGQGKRFGERFLEHLKSQDPERFERIQRLRKENPDEFRKEMGKIFSSFRSKYFKEDTRVGALLNEYQAADTEVGKKAIKEKLMAVIKDGFEKRMKMKEQELEHLKNRIDQMEKALESYRNSQESICEKRLQELLSRGADRRSGQPDGNDDGPRPGHHPGDR